MNRRDFLKSAAVVTAAAASIGAGASPTTSLASEPTARRLPRWRGFNLLEKFDVRRAGAFRESDFDLMAEWGFDFVRLPCSYLTWTDAADWNTIHDERLKDIDDAVKFGRDRGIHVNINFHRAPGYCCNPPKEPADLFADDAALDVCAKHWAHFARRYKGIASRDLSFNLLNEPVDATPERYAAVVGRLAGAIREHDAGRLILADGLHWGTRPVPSLAALNVAQSAHTYAPMQVTHYKASWVEGSDTWPEPTWPIEVPPNHERWDRAHLRTAAAPWEALAASGTGVHVGEFGVHNRTPHAVTLAWLADWLGVFRDCGFGWAVWNFRGSFGPLDSGRADVTYETYKGHKVDRKMLELLRAS